MKTKTNGIPWLAGAFFCAGSSVVAAKPLTDAIGPFTLTCLSLAFCILSLLPVCTPKRLSALWRIGWPGWRELLLEALLGIVLFRLFLLPGLTMTSAGEAGLLTGLSPALTALFARLALRERMSPWKGAGLALTLVGALAMQVPHLGTAAGWRNLAGNALVLLAATSESLFSVRCRVNAVRAQAEGAAADSLHPLCRTAVVSCCALLPCLPPACLEQPLARVAVLGPAQWLALLWYGAGVTALGYGCWYAGIRRSSASTAAVMTGVMPLTSMVLSLAVLGERPTGWMLAGGGMLLAGLLLAALAERTSEALQAPPAVQTPDAPPNPSVERVSSAHHARPQTESGAGAGR